MQQGWYPTDIIAALKKRGTLLAAVSHHAGMAKALNRRGPKGEGLIAEAAPHFTYQICHNPLNRKNSFLLLTFLPRTKLPPARNAS